MHPLTPRETQIARLLALGHSTKSLWAALDRERSRVSISS